MTDIIHIQDQSTFKSTHDEKTIFKEDVLFGLKKPFKELNSKYFYDEYGSILFNKITKISDYYLTNSELAILHASKKELSNWMKGEPFNLIELGPGEGIKPTILIQQFLEDSLTFRYVPIDISTKYLNNLIQQFNSELPQLELAPIHADYFKGLAWQSDHSHRKNLVLFLGSSIGNLNPEETFNFIKALWNLLHNDDYLLLGFDLKKDIKLLMRAYDDRLGITRDFNLNLLKRINRELGGHFNLNKFAHYATYNVYKSAMESYLVSMSKQVVSIDSLEQDFYFDTIEPIHMEYSYKYHLEQIEEMAKQTGFEVIKNFKDSQQYFVDSLWQVKK